MNLKDSEQDFYSPHKIVNFVFVSKNIHMHLQLWSKLTFSFKILKVLNVNLQFKFK